jgi:hypothetical protein
MMHMVIDDEELETIAREANITHGKRQVTRQQRRLRSLMDDVASQYPGTDDDVLRDILADAVRSYDER